jgi:hypothetical protein
MHINKLIRFSASVSWLTCSLADAGITVLSKWYWNNPLRSIPLREARFDERLELSIVKTVITRIIFTQNGESLKLSYPMTHFTTFL